MFRAIARSVIAHPWWTIVVWLIGAVAVIALSPSLAKYTTASQLSFLPSSFESAQAQKTGLRYFPSQSGASGSLVIARSDGGALTADDQGKASALAKELTEDGIPGLAAVQVTANSIAPNGKVALLQVVFKGQPGDTQVNNAVKAVRSQSDAFLAGSGLTNGLTGNAAIQVDTIQSYGHAQTIITVATLVLIVLMLGIIFRSPVIAVLPIVVIGLVHQVTVGLAADLARAFRFQVSTSLGPILVVVLFGIGTDYIVFLLFRYRERLRHGLPHKEALEFSCAVVGKVVASSALTVMGAFAALLLAPGLLVAVAVMMVTALTLIPALFSLLGEALFWPFGHGSVPGHNSFAAEGALVARRPAVVAGVIVLILAGLTVAAFGYKATYNTLAELPSTTKSQVAYNELRAGFPPGALSPTQVYVTGSGPLSQSSLTPLVQKLTALSGVARVAAPQPSVDGTAALVTVILKDDPFSTSSLDYVEHQVRTAAHGSVAGDQVLVGGQPSTLVDVRNQLGEDTRVVFPVAAAIILVILGLLLLSPLAPLNLLVCVALAFAATLGGAVLVFLGGLGYAGIDFSLPIVLYLFVVAIGTDYNILLASRLREEYVNGYSPREAARIAIANDTPTVAAAGIILALTFASLMLTGIANLTELGFGVAAGIVIAAFGMAPLLVPCLSALEGRAFWWPARSRPIAANGSESARGAPAAAAARPVARRQARRG